MFSEIYYASFALFKLLVLGYSRDGDVVSSELGFLRLWLLQHFVFDANFNHGLTRWRGTEVISLKFRLLGMSVGSRVQIDNLQVVEHELVHIGDNVLFGSNSVYSNLRVGPKGVSKHEIRIHQFAATLDNTVLEAGCNMEEYSLAGSRSCIADSSSALACRRFDKRSLSSHTWRSRSGTMCSRKRSTCCSVTIASACRTHQPQWSGESLWST